MDELHKQETREEQATPLVGKSDIHSSIQSATQDTAVGALDIIENFGKEKILTSRRFVDKIRQIDEKIRSEAIGKALEYLVLHPDGFEFWEFTESLKDACANASEHDLDENAAKLYVQSVYRKLKLVDDGSVSSKEKFIDYCTEHLVRNGTYFHGFNGVFEKQIREEGLTPDRRQWDWDELRRIHDICQKAGKGMVLGWSFLNCEGKTSLSADARSTYRYANVSPEWFAQFVCEGHHIPVEGRRKTAFNRRNYEDARSNVVLLCDQMMSAKQEDVDAGKAYPNISSSEREEILLFFEKYWEKLAGPDSRPKVALTSIDMLYEDPEDFKEYVRKTNEGLKELASDMDFETMMGIFFSKFQSDMQVQNGIPKGKIEILDLPEYTAVFDE